MTPDITRAEADAIVATRTYPRITKELIEEKIYAVEYLIRDQLTICVITMQNGFSVIGKAAPMDPRNYDEQVGERYAYDDAFAQLWALEAYHALSLNREGVSLS